MRKAIQIRRGYPRNLRGLGFVFPSRITGISPIVAGNASFAPDANDPSGTTIRLPNQDFTVPILSPAASQPTTPIPTNGPLPPGAGYQQVEAPGNPFPYVYIGTGGTPPPYLQPFPSLFTSGPPAGSYTQTCQNISIDASGNLVALCRDLNGNLVSTSLPNWSLCSGDIANNNGQLQCGASGFFSPTLPLPGQTLLPSLPAAAPASSGGSVLQFFANNWYWFAGGIGLALFLKGRR